MSKKPIKIARNTEVLNELKAFELKWTCVKGHVNFITALEEPKIMDCCLKCGQVYQIDHIF